MSSPVKTGTSSPSILIISALDFWSMGEGKGGSALYNTISSYANRGWKVTFITSNSNRDGADTYHENIRVYRFETPLLKRLMKIRKIGYFAKMLWWLRFQITAFMKAQRLPLKHEIDVVYGYEIYGAPVARALSRRWNIPLVTRFQGTSFGADWHGRKFRGLRAWEHRVGLLTPADLIIMTNDGTQGDRVLKEIGADMGKVRFWMNGMDRGLFSDMPDPDSAKRMLGLQDRHVLLCVSRLVGWKHLERSIEALSGVLEEYHETVLVIVGDGPERKKLVTLAEELGIGERVNFMGAVPHSEIPRYLAAADIFLSLYDWSNVGNPLLESMMAGKCIVTLNNGDTGRFVINNENGVLLEYEDLPKLSGTITDLLAHETHRKRLGQNARKFADEHFRSWETRMDMEVSEVSELIGQSSA